MTGKLSYPEIVLPRLRYRFCPMCATALTSEVDQNDGLRRVKCPQCHWVHYPPNTVGVNVIVWLDGKLVAILPPNAPAATPAALPGGHIEYGESPEVAAMREVYEETGLIVEIVRSLGWYFEPNLEMIELGLADLLWERIGEQFRAFIGGTVFEELCREWVVLQAKQRQLPFTPEIVGSHWAADVQIDVVALNWRDKQIFLGECKWGANPVGREVIQDLIEKAPKVAPSADWQIHYAVFARAGFSTAAHQTATTANAMLVDLTRLDTDLRAMVTLLT